VTFHLARVGQVAMSVADVDRAEDFYGRTLGLAKLYRFGDLLFFDCAGLRLMLQRSAGTSKVEAASPLYFACADLGLAMAELTARGVAFTTGPTKIAAMEDHDLWMAFFADPDGHLLALMCEAPKGHVFEETPG